MITYVVKVSYYNFNFKYRNDAIDFATKAKIHADEDIEVKIIIEISEPCDLQDAIDPVNLLDPEDD